jgi:hypothetical protein
MRLNFVLSRFRFAWKRSNALATRRRVLRMGEAMPAHKIEIAPEVIAEGKRLYERTQTPLRDIAAYMGITRWTLDDRIREWGWQRRRAPAASVDLHRAARGALMVAVTDDAPPSDGQVLPPASQERREAVAARIQNAVESAIGAVERVLDKLDPADAAEAERDGRTLAGVSRTLRELTVANQLPEASPPHETDDDPVPSDVDEFRFELVRRIRGFIEARRQGAGGLHAEPEVDVDRHSQD